MRLYVSIAAVCSLLTGSVITAQDAVSNKPAVAAPVQAAAASANAVKVERAVLSSSVEDREPAGISNKFSKDSKEIFFFTHITGAKDSVKIEHRWYHNGRLMQTSILPVKSTSWRTFSKRSLISSDKPAGEWKVEAVEQVSGLVLSSLPFLVE